MAVEGDGGDGGVYEALFEARPPLGWHLYDLGPYDNPALATLFDFSASSGLELVGGPYETGVPVHKYDPVFGFETGYFDLVAGFGQKVRPTAPGAILAGEVEYQICNDKSCVSAVWEFSVPVGPQGDPAFAVANPQGDPASAVANPLGEAGRNSDGGIRADSPLDGGEAGGGSLWSMILGAILWGFAALLTPCVFPMVPMTVSFFMKDGRNAATGRFKALAFGLFIVALYTLPIAVIILIARFAGGEAVTADSFNWLATHWIPNVLFFVVFLVFAASLLGAFELRMPSKLVNRSDRGAEKGGLVGVFFLALTLVLVSFSCTGPIVGGALISSTQQGEFWAPILTMLLFSTAFALPFTLLAFFPGLIDRLPKSGGWLNSVKVTLGLVEIALGLKFLSVADQTYHWGVLDREVYLAIWIVVFSLLGFYLLGKIRFKHDSPVEHTGVVRLALAIAVFSFVVYLVPGMWGAPLKAVSGYLPPRSTQDLFMGDGHTQAVSAQGAQEKIKYSDFLHMPPGMDITAYFDFEQGLAAARAQNKPVFLDFTGHGCVNCREMEEKVWADAEVQRILREEYVVVALYSDDRTRLPEAEWFTTPAGRVLKSLGRKNSYLVNTRYGVSAQPAYLLLDGNGERLAPVYGYDLDVDKYVAFLRNGVEAYKK